MSDIRAVSAASQGEFLQRPPTARLGPAQVIRGFVAAWLSGMTACTAIEPKVVVDETGLKSHPGENSFEALKLIYDSARVDAKVANPTDAQTAELQANSYALVKAGTSVSYQLCSSFFKTAGNEQQILLFSRDVIGIVGTLATGILGATHAAPAATAWVGIGSGAALSGISIYARNFLFSEDNVQAVENLTLTAMSRATKAALDRGPRGYDFETAVQAIMDVQAVCEVQSILSLVRQSINQAQPTATVAGNGDRIGVSVPAQTAVQTVVVAPATAAVIAALPNRTALVTRIKNLTNNQMPELIQQIAPTIDQSVSPVVIASRTAYPHWKTNVASARIMFDAILYTDNGALAPWTSAITRAEQKPK